MTNYEKQLYRIKDRFPDLMLGRDLLLLLAQRLKRWKFNKRRNANVAPPAFYVIHIKPKTDNHIQRL